MRIVFNSSVATGHGSDNNPFYHLREIGTKYVPEAWDSIETCQGNAFVNEALGHPSGEKLGEEVHSNINYLVYKQHDSWLAALKGVAKAVGNKDIQDEIKLPEKVEEKLEHWFW